MQVGFLNFPAWQKAFNKAAWEGKSCFWGGVTESGKERIRQESSVVKDKTLCCRKSGYLGASHHGHPEELSALPGQANDWSDPSFPWSSCTCTPFTWLPGREVYFPALWLYSRPSNLPWPMGGLRIWYEPEFEIHMWDGTCHLVLLLSPWKGHASRKCSSSEDERCGGAQNPTHRLEPSPATLSLHH